MSGDDVYPPKNAEEFASSLGRRREAASELEKDLLTEVPLLYGQSGWDEVELARIRRNEMRRRSGEGEGKAEPLPFERATAALVVLIFLIVLLAK